MLSTPDAKLVQRDPQILSLRQILDPDAFVAMVRTAFPHLEVSHAESAYIRYKPGTSCLVGYHAQTKGGEMYVYAKGYCHYNGNKVDKEIASSSGGTKHDTVWANASRAVILATFPFDSGIPALESLVRYQGDDRLTRELGFRANKLTWLSYKPERRAVAQLTAESRSLNETMAGTHQVLLRLYSDSAYQSAARRWKVGLPSMGVRIPRRLANCESIAALATEWLEGESCNSSQAEHRGDLTSALPLLAESLARLHAATAADVPMITPELRAREVQALALDLRTICPEAGGMIAMLGADLCESLVQYRGNYGLTHGDLHSGQIMLNPQEMALVDWDELALADPATDLASLVAHLYKRQVNSPETWPLVDSLAESLLQNYSRWARGFSSLHWNVQLSAAIFRIAMQPFRERSAQWDISVVRLLELSSTILARRVERRSYASGTANMIRRDTDLAESSCEAWEVNPLHPTHIADKLLDLVSTHRPELSAVRLRGIRMTRLKPARRMLIEYDCLAHSADAAEVWLTVVGKVRFKGVKKSACSVQAWLASHGLGTHLVGPLDSWRVRVPAVIGMIPEANIWLQEYVPGLPLTTLMSPDMDLQLADRVADGLWELHQTSFPADHEHTIDDELTILNERLMKAQTLSPIFATRIEKLRKGCMALRRVVADCPTTGIHRDFYPSQVLVDGPRLTFLDFDLACRGAPALDVGNFLAHCTEHAIRHYGVSNALQAFEERFHQRYLGQSGASPLAIEVFTLLSLARHMFLSMTLPKRQETAATILEVCEQNLADLQLQIGSSEGPGALSHFVSSL